VLTLQNTAEPFEARRSACDTLLAASKSEGSCAVLCSAGAIHSVFATVKGPGEPLALIKTALALLSNLYKFDSKLVSVVARLQVRCPPSGVPAVAAGVAVPAPRGASAPPPPPPLRLLTRAVLVPRCRAASPRCLMRCAIRLRRKTRRCCWRSSIPLPTSPPAHRTRSCSRKRTGSPCFSGASSRTSRTRSSCCRRYRCACLWPYLFRSGDWPDCGATTPKIEQATLTANQAQNLSQSRGDEAGVWCKHTHIGRVPLTMQTCPALAQSRRRGRGVVQAHPRR